MSKGQILVVDDEAAQREILRTILGADGYRVESAGSVAEAVALSEATRFDLVLTDLRMPGEDGMSLIQRLTRDDPPTLVILMTAYGSMDSAERALGQGAFDYLTKPLNREDLLHTVSRAFERIRLIEENRLLRRQLEERFRVEGLVGSHYRLQEVFAKIHKVSNSTSTVLITGETGTGKELIARAIHRNSPRKDRPFVAVSCAAIPDSLIESELFGHERGSFTGAIGRHQGLFEGADRSTLFLDEVAELSVNMQAKVLRALQERTIRRVGGREDIKVDVRILAATNKDLETEVRRGAFREDLYYRLNVVTITVPPLRERSTDIPQLAEYFVARVCREGGRPPLPITTEAMRLLTRYPWPGNVRQLEAVLQRAALLSDGKRIDIADLPIEVRFSTLPQEEPQAPPAASAGGTRYLLVPQGINLEEVERDFILQAMQQSGGVVAKAAKLLGLSYRTLQYRLEKYHIRRDGGGENAGAEGSPQPTAVDGPQTEQEPEVRKGGMA
ncbi:MAG: sigma-54-dependent Fis family transcriptional regulator [candidate division NC10 bacterium]|nr:sigma-54-dependent Fis family transcriptional regulator [candidate division NC10 bacterium]